MNKALKKYQNYFIPLVLILIVSFSRLIPHPYNFTPLLATGIFAGFYFKQFYLSLFIVIFSMFIGDLFLGFHSTMFFTYVALIVPVLFGIYAKHLKIYSILTSSVISSISFILIIPNDPGPLFSSRPRKKFLVTDVRAFKAKS